MADDSDVPIKQRRNVPGWRSNFLFVVACGLALGLTLVTLTSVLNIPVVSSGPTNSSKNSELSSSIFDDAAGHSDHLLSASLQATSHYQAIPPAYAQELESKARANRTFKHFTLVAGEGTTTLPTGDTITVWSFNGTYPSPTIRVNQGDVVELTVINPSTNRVPHSIEIHGSQLSAVPNFGSIPPGEEKTMTFLAVNAGVWAYHCEGVNVFALWSHALRGMAGMLIVDPKEGYPELPVNTIVPTNDPTMNVESQEKKFDGPAREFSLLYSEWYLRNETTGPQNGTQAHDFDLAKMLDEHPTYAHANAVPFGYAGALFTLPPWDGSNPNNQPRLSNLLTADNLLAGNPNPRFLDLIAPDANGHTPVTHLHVKQGEHVRFFVQNTGDKNVAWHTVGEQLDRVSVGANVLAKGIQTWNIPPYGDATIDVVFEQPGVYAPVNHNYALLVKGQIAIIEVHPENAVLPPNPSNAVPPDSQLGETSISQSTCLYGLGPDNMGDTADDHAFISECGAFEPPPPNDGSSFPVTHMSNTTASAGYGVYAQKPARAEYVTNSSQLVGDKIDYIALKLKRVGTINGTAEVGILNEDLSVKKLFGTLDVSALATTYTDYEFKLTGDELYQIEEGDRIGIKYEGGGFNETSWVSVMLDLDPADPFDGANSYLQYHYQGAWRQSPDIDLHAVLKQTHE
jgi:nitrite reductase (NO-forming)